MQAHGIECCHGTRKSRSAWPGGAVGGVLFAVVAALVPKCPMCIAAWLGVLGLTGFATRVDPRAMWLFALFAALAVALGGAAISHRLLGRIDIKKGDGT